MAPRPAVGISGGRGVIRTKHSQAVCTSDQPVPCSLIASMSSNRHPCGHSRRLQAGNFALSHT